RVRRAGQDHPGGGERDPAPGRREADDGRPPGGRPGVRGRLLRHRNGARVPARDLDDGHEAGRSQGGAGAPFERAPERVGRRPGEPRITLYNRFTLYAQNPRPSDLPMAVGRRRFDEDKVVKYETPEKDYEVEVSRTLNKWCVTVYQLPDRQILVQDFFPERWKALARAQDFLRLLNQRKKKDEEGLSHDDDF